jgi:cardiolipin synthase
MEGPTVSDAAMRFDDAWRRLGGCPGDAVEVAGVAGSSRVLLIDSPSKSGRRTVGEMHDAVMASARRQVSNRNPFFLPNEDRMQSIAAATKRGVEVRVILPGRRMAHRILLDANRYRYRSVLASGVRIFEFQPAMMHAKTIVVDGTLTLVGSANFDPRSLYSNDDLTAAISDADVAGSMEEQFSSDLADCVEVCYPPSGRGIERARRSAAASLMRFF